MYIILTAVTSVYVFMCFVRVCCHSDLMHHNKTSGHLISIFRQWCGLFLFISSFSFYLSSLKKLRFFENNKNI